MRVAVVHSFYRSDQPSGENVAVLQQVGALRNAGIEILEVFRSTDEESEAPLYKVRSAISVATGVDFGHPQRAISEFAPDLVHVHNTFPNFGTRWLTKLQIPIVTTLHNFRASCANGLLYRDGHICLECPTSGSKAAFVHGCWAPTKERSITPTPRARSASSPSASTGAPLATGAWSSSASPNSPSATTRSDTAIRCRPASRSRPQQPAPHHPRRHRQGPSYAAATSR